MKGDTVWRKLISLKHGMEEGDLFSRTPRGNHRTRLWKAINIEAAQMKQYCSFDLGDGQRIRLWKDAWCGDVPLNEVFPGLYSIADSKGAKVVEMWEIEGEAGAWNPRFLRSFNDWELNTIQQLLSLLASKKLMPQRSDKLLWKGSQQGEFTMKTYSKILEGGSSRQAPVKILWNPSVPSKVGFFAWEAWWGKVLTMEQMKKSEQMPFLWKE